MGKTGRKGERFSLRRALALDVVQEQAWRDALYRQGLVHFDCRGALQAENCRGILCFDGDRLVLDMGRARLRITGLGLTVETYHQALLAVRGQIFSVEVLPGGPSGGENGGVQ